MTGFELAYRCTEPLLPPLYRTVRRHLHSIARSQPSGWLDLLDIGGRKSHYTIGIPAEVIITDLPRETDVLVRLNLGITDAIASSTSRRRSNVRDIVYDDMTRSNLPDGSFDCAVAVEVLEHVEQDREFVREVRRVLRPGGVFLMTTPNGDEVPHPHNPDHKRHYARTALQALLRDCFEYVDVEYAIVGGAFRRVGLQSWSARRPLRTAASMAGNLINHVQSARPGVRERARGTRHLIAVARRGA